MSDWYPFKSGDSIGQAGSEGGKILCDEEHADGARVTLEHVRDSRFTVTGGIYGWLVHTRFFNSEPTARIGFDETEDELSKILALIPIENEADDDKLELAKVAIADFVERCE
ncbi:MAG: hypothetical protein ACREA9_28220 [Pyrinomonadaceae bacterium]